MKKVVFIGVVSALIFSLSLVQSASAHFYVTDANTGVKAIFHVTPDHNPIAGEESIISFDFAKTGFKADNFSYLLTIKSTKTEAVTVPVEVSGNVVLTDYVFPSQGFYSITLTATDKNDSSVSTLKYGQRVSRGETTEEQKGFGLFEIVIISGVGVIGAGAIIFSLINDRRKQKG